MTLSINSIISERRVATLNRLVALASDKAEAEQLVRELEQIDKMLVSMDNKDTARFAQFKLPIEAIVAYLQEVRRPSTEREIIDALIEGKFRGGGQNTPFIVQ